jgi:hypothetical protein
MVSKNNNTVKQVSNRSTFVFLEINSEWQIVCQNNKPTKSAHKL